MGPLPAGGITDVVGPLIAQNLGLALDANVIVENRGTPGVMVKADSLFKNCKDLLEASRAKEVGLTFASVGLGT